MATERERLLTLLSGGTPDRVPLFLDLGHWYRWKRGGKWDLFTITCRTEEMAELHRRTGAGWYIEAGALHTESFSDGYGHTRALCGEYAVERFFSPKAELVMKRRWNPISCSWDITEHLVKDTEELAVFTDIIRHKEIVPELSVWEEMERIGGDVGLGFPHLGYTGLGSLISYYMGVEATVFAMYDEPELFGEYISVWNEKQLLAVDIAASSAAPHFIFGDNLSSDLQPPEMFRKYSFGQYERIAQRLHAAKKTVSAHLDGRLSGILSVVEETGVDVADACTPAPTGDLTPREIREQAGDMIVMGGISPEMWLPETPDEKFSAHVRAWLDTREKSPRLVQSAGDQVPPGTELSRIMRLREIVDEYGRY